MRLIEYKLNVFEVENSLLYISQKIKRQSTEGLLYTYKLVLGGLHNRLEDFVLLPVPPGFMVRTRITRVKKGMAGRLYPFYYMHLEREGPGDRKVFDI